MIIVLNCEVIREVRTERNLYLSHKRNLAGWGSAVFRAGLEAFAALAAFVPSDGDDRKDLRKSHLFLATEGETGGCGENLSRVSIEMTR